MVLEKGGKDYTECRIRVLMFLLDLKLNRPLTLHLKKCFFLLRRCSNASVKNCCPICDYGVFSAHL